jgi:RHS repeat-associated protein
MPVTKYIWDGENCMMETDGTGAVQTVYTYEPEQYGNLISSRVSGTTYYHHYDALGSTRQLSTAVGAVSDTWIYDAWGNIVARTGTTAIFLQWVGQLGYYYDAGTGTFWVRERPLEPVNARWTTIDPAEFDDGPDRYRYASNNPFSLTDPSGLKLDTSLPGYYPPPVKKPKPKPREKPKGQYPPPAHNIPIQCYKCTLDSEAATCILALGPFICVKAEKIGEGAHHMTDQMAKQHNLTALQADAFRHCYVSCRLTLEFGWDAAGIIMDIHEACFNQGPGPRCMDLWNNAVGREIPQLYYPVNADCTTACLEGLPGILNEETKGHLQVVETCPPGTGTLP